MQGHDPAQADDVESSTRARAQFERVSAFRAEQIGEMVFEKLVALFGGNMNVRMIRTAMAQERLAGPGWKHEAIIQFGQTGSMKM